MPTTTQTNKTIAPTSVLTGRAVLNGAAVTGQDTDTPTNTVKVLEAGSEGARITSVYTALSGTIVATRTLLFIGNDATGTTKRVVGSKAHTAYTHSSSTDPTAAQAPAFAFSDNAPLILGPGESLWAGQLAAQTGSPIVVHAEGGKYNTP